MFTRIILLSVSVATAVRIPSIPNVTFVPISPSSSTTVTNRSCDQCLCDSYSSHMILNCFASDTCQFFVDAPCSYKLEPTPNALVYFPRQVFPKASECWMPNTSFLLNRLNTTTPTYANVSYPLCLVLDDHGYLVTVSLTNRSIFRFHPNNLTRIEQPPSPIFADPPHTLAHHGGAYYVGFIPYILVVDSSSMSQIHNISTPSLYGTRDMIFFNDGQQMMVVSMNNRRLIFFNRSSSMPHNYDFIGYQTVSCQSPHGLFYVSDTLFYLTSRADHTVYTYSNVGNITSWAETLVLNVSSSAYLPNGLHVSVDNNDRYWFSMGLYGMKIFNSQGSLLGSLYPTDSNIFDTLILNNYVIYLADCGRDRLVRIDPTIQC